MSFEYLGLSDALLKAVADAGYDTPTPIQRQAIPAILQGRDVIGIAQTGTGKTAGFTLPMIDILSEGRAKARMPRTLILEPTRELAAQVSESFEKYGKNSKLTMALLIGGVSFADQEAKLERGVDVLIATPGRLLDHFGRGKLMLNGVQILVVDECDRMLDMGFIPDVEAICSKMPQAHQTLFFSATLSKEIKRLTDQFLNDPKLIEVAPPSTTAATVEQSVLIVSARDKAKALGELLADPEVQNAIVFCNRKVEVKAVYASLKRANISVGQLHGDMAQPDRMDMLARFKAGEITTLIASDVAARGLDIPLVSHVFNYDVPHNPEDYVHRIGRTGRAGRKGAAITMAAPHDMAAIADIEALIGRKIERSVLEGIKTPDFDPEDEEARKKRRPGRSFGRNTAPKASAAPKSSNPARNAAAKPAEKPKPVREAQKETTPAEKPKPAASAAPSRKAPADKGRPQASRNARPPRPVQTDNRDNRDDGGVVGLGAHVPAFLTRPVKR